MLTPTGRAMAEERVEWMESFRARFCAKSAGRAQPVARRCAGKAGTQNAQQVGLLRASSPVDRLGPRLIRCQAPRSADHRPGAPAAGWTCARPPLASVMRSSRSLIRTTFLLTGFRDDVAFAQTFGKGFRGFVHLAHGQPFGIGGRPRDCFISSVTGASVRPRISASAGSSAWRRRRARLLRLRLFAAASVTAAFRSCHRAAPPRHGLPHGLSATRRVRSGYRQPAGHQIG